MEDQFPLSLPAGTSAVSLPWHDHDGRAWIVEGTAEGHKSTWKFGKVSTDTQTPFPLLLSVVYCCRVYWRSCCSPAYSMGCASMVFEGVDSSFYLCTCRRPVLDDVDLCTGSMDTQTPADLLNAG